VRFLAVLRVARFLVVRRFAVFFALRRFAVFFAARRFVVRRLVVRFFAALRVVRFLVVRRFVVRFFAAFLLRAAMIVYANLYAGNVRPSTLKAHVRCFKTLQVHYENDNELFYSYYRTLKK